MNQKKSVIARNGAKRNDVEIPIEHSRDCHGSDKSEPRNDKAKLVEIFSSIQGEGLRVGEKQTFVRFQGCSLKCRWCDTPENFTYKKEYRVEEEAFSGNWVFHPNPVSPKDLTKWLKHFGNPVVSLTGGEPLEQLDFLKAWLPKVSNDFRIFLETGGVEHEALKEVLDWVDIVSMDIKLPSSANTGDCWERHEAFLKIAKKAPEFYVKIVVTEDSLSDDLEKACEMIVRNDPHCYVIIQPASATRGFKKIPSFKKLSEFATMAEKWTPKIRVIPQTHKYLGIS